MERERERKDGGCRVCGSRAREGRVHERAVQSGVILWIRTTLLWRTEVEISFAHTHTHCCHLKIDEDSHQVSAVSFAFAYS